MNRHNWIIEIYTFVENLQRTKHPSYVKISKISNAKYLLQYIVGFLNLMKQISI